MSSPLPHYLAPLTVPASWVYRCAITARNRHYDRGNGVRRLDVPVISVGNITTGGVGKTPMVAWIARLLLDAGRRPAICMRGYGATRTLRSDEQMEYEAILPDVPVIADPDRATAAAAFLRAHSEIDCLLLDDGFQHRQLHRDLDLVLIDATQSLANERLLPAGHLREPLSSLSRADAIIYTRVDQVEPEDVHSGYERLRRILNPNCDACGYSLYGLPATIRRCPECGALMRPAARSRHTWTGLRLYHTDSGKTTSSEVATDWLAGKRVVTLLGVGNPDAIEQQIERSGASILASSPARDHERYTMSKLMLAHMLADGADAIVMTRKDWVKARHVIESARWHVPVIVPDLAIEIIEGREALEAMILGVKARVSGG